MVDVKAPILIVLGVSPNYKIWWARVCLGAIGIDEEGSDSNCEASNKHSKDDE